MRSFLVSCLAAIVIALGAVVVLQYAAQKSVTSAFTSATGVELRGEAHL
jgi:hypothetical protein